MPGWSTSVVASLAILGWFKYANFFAGNLNAALAALGSGVRVPLPEMLLPAGISFYMFKTMSYTIDIYRRETRAGALADELRHLHHLLPGADRRADRARLGVPAADGPRHRPQRASDCAPAPASSCSASPRRC